MQDLSFPVSAFHWWIPLVALILSLIFTPVVIWVARKKKWVAMPQKDRWHTRPVALMGGIAIFAAVVGALVFQPDLFVNWLWAGAAIMFVTGLIDDRYHLSPLVKLLVQLFAAGLLVAAGYHLIPTLPIWISVPVTFFWIIGVTNAVNLLDNMDGLSAGVTAIGLGIVGGLLVTFDQVPTGILVLSVAAACIGFLLYNFKPAKIFMGDSGSLFLGHMLAGSVLVLINSTPSLDGISALFIAVSLVAVPIFDTTMVTLNRVLRGISPAQGGRDHVSHRLVTLGLSDRASVLFLYLVAGLFGALAVWSFYVQPLPFYLIFLLGVVGLGIFGSFLSRLNVYPPEMTKQVVRLSNLPMALKNRVQLLGMGVDLLLVVLAFSIAHYIRFETWTPDMEQAILHVIPGVVVLKLVVFYLFGLYMGIWKHAGVMELLRIVAGVFTATLLAGIFCWVYTGSYLSISVFAIDFLILSSLVAGSRFAFKGLRRVFARQLSTGSNLLLYGAGDAGWLALSEIRQNPSLSLNPVGFIDDSDWKQNGVVQGLRVLGTGVDLQKICMEHHIDEVIITISEIPEEMIQKISLQCESAGVTCKLFTASFTDVEAPSNQKQDAPRYQMRKIH